MIGKGGMYIVEIHQFGDISWALNDTKHQFVVFMSFFFRCLSYMQRASWVMYLEEIEHL